MKKRLIFVILLIVIGLGSFYVFRKNGGTENTVNIFKDKKEYKTYKAGDRIDFASRSWIVLYNSSEKDDTITAISSEVMFLEDIPYAINGIYETSKINEYLKGTFLKELGEDNLVSKNGYKVRLFNEDDMKKILKYNYNSDDDSYNILECPDYVCLYNSVYATMIDTHSIEKENVYNNIDDISDLDTDDYQLHLKYYNISNDFGDEKLESIVNDATLIIRPVINLKKSSL